MFKTLLFKNVHACTNCKGKLCNCNFAKTRALTHGRRLPNCYQNLQLVSPNLLSKLTGKVTKMLPKCYQNVTKMLPKCYYYYHQNIPKLLPDYQNCYRNGNDGSLQLPIPDISRDLLTWQNLILWEYEENQRIAITRISEFPEVFIAKFGTVVY